LPQAHKAAAAIARSAINWPLPKRVPGDRWSLLIIRDTMLREFRTYKEFLGSYERIATNILADRLQKLITHGIISADSDPTPGQNQPSCRSQRWSKT